MAGGTGVYITWVTGSIVLSIALMYVFKPPWARITLSGFQDMFRRYWAHMILTFSIYLWKDISNIPLRLADLHHDAFLRRWIHDDHLLVVRLLHLFR